MYDPNVTDDDVVVVRHAHDEDVVHEPAPLEPGIGATTDDVYYRPADKGRVNNYALRKINQIIWLVAVVLELLILFRVFLKLIAANPQSGFANFVYAITAPFLAPFAGLTSTPSASGSVLEISSLIAMVAYALLFWLIAYVVRLIWGR
ncbi:MAG: YggT family protein [Ardenticatenaceae bacterium]|nr:YggT family protein [Ardenticatenaceae bacterium]